jgi:hypothetical protein
MPAAAAAAAATAQVRRRVAALREVQEKQDTLMKDFVRERAELEAKYQQQLGESFTGRASARGPSPLLGEGPKPQGGQGLGVALNPEP